MTKRHLIAGLLLGCTPTALAAQTQPAPQPAPAPLDEETGEEIVVTGERERGSVLGDIAPELQLGPADIRSYGVATIAELLTELAPQTGSGRGRGGGGGPVVLLNGRRISGFQEIRDLPTEAVERVDILPEEVALKYGYRADQRVVNIVLRRRFRAYTVDIDTRVPTAGGTANFEAEAGLLRINRDGRTSIDLEYESQSRLLESERDIIAAAPGRPFAIRGNVSGIGGGEIDPALSALAGSPVFVAGVPVGTPTLAGFVGTAGVLNTTDARPYRTLVSASDRFAANAVIARTIFGNVSATANIRLEAQGSQSWRGLPGTTLTVPGASPFSPFGGGVLLDRYASLDPLNSTSRGWTGRGAFTLGGDIPGWRWSLTGSYDRAETHGRTETGVDATAFQAALLALDPATDPFGSLAGLPVLTDRSRTLSGLGTVDALFSGNLFALPAGDVATSIRVGASTSDYDSWSLRSGVIRSGSVARDQVNGQINLDLPIASGSRDVLGFLGDLSVNGNVEVEQLSDFGTLTTLGYGLNWSPVAPVTLLVSRTIEDGAPTAQQLGDPLVATSNVRVYDFVRGETVDVTRLTGGTPGLVADNRQVFSARLTVKPLAKTDLVLTANFLSETIDNPIAAFPSATAEIEAAFPGRFVRDGSGRLLQIDSRPINFERSERQEFRWGFNFSKAIPSLFAKRVAEARARGETIPGLPSFPGLPGGGGRPGGAGQGAPGGMPGAGPRGPGGGGGRGPGGGFGGGPGGGGGGRLQFAAYHTVHLKETILIRPGVPELDLLNGSATGSTGGQSRHEVEVQGGVARDGLGARLSANWRSATRVDATGGDSLRFSDLGTINLRLFASLGPQMKIARDNRWLRGVRLTLSVDNIFDARQRVTDGNGVVPISYQPDYLDPQGRTVRIGIRKLLF